MDDHSTATGSEQAASRPPDPTPEAPAERTGEWKQQAEEWKQKYEQAEKARSGAMSAKAKAEEEWKRTKEALETETATLRAKGAAADRDLSDANRLNEDLARKHKEAAELAQTAGRHLKRMVVAAEAEIPEWHDALPDTDDEAALKAKAEEIRARLGKALQKAGEVQSLLDGRPPRPQGGAKSIQQLQQALVNEIDPDRMDALQGELERLVRAERGLQ